MNMISYFLSFKNWNNMLRNGKFKNFQFKKIIFL